MNDYIEIIKNQFFSTDNIDFIIKIANSKNISIISYQITFNACNNIYNQFIHTVYTQKKTINPQKIEELLITLNKMVIDLIIDNYENNPLYENETIDSFNENILDTHKLDTHKLDTRKLDTHKLDTHKLDTHKLPIDTRQIPIDTRQIPIDTHQIPIDTHQIPIDTHQIPIDTHQIPIDTHQIPLDTHKLDTTTNDIMNNLYIKRDITREGLYLFSEDSLFKDGEYNFEFRRKGIKNLQLQSFEILNNLYNVTETNNTIEISEKNDKKIINIPVGCYKLKDLIECLEKSILDKCKSNNIKVTHDTYKNQISIKGDGPFSINFIENENLFIPFRFMLGFDKKNYMNNDIYLTSKHPVCNIYDNIYIKITTKKYSDIFNTKWCKDFNFYDTISFKQLDTFGNDIRINISNNNISNTSIDIDDISLELYHRHIHHRKFYKINQRLKFLMIFNIDKIA
jgi:hypothetical protein